MNLQLYQVDDVNYLVDFHHKRTYKASTEPCAGKYDMAFPRVKKTRSLPTPPAESNRIHGMETESKGYDVVSPFVFMDVACRLIILLMRSPLPRRAFDD